MWKQCHYCLWLKYSTCFALHTVFYANIGSPTVSQTSQIGTTWSEEDFKQIFHDRKSHNSSQWLMFTVTSWTWNWFWSSPSAIINKCIKFHPKEVLGETRWVNLIPEPVSVSVRKRNDRVTPGPWTEGATLICVRMISFSPVEPRLQTKTLRMW